nr:hypothetical protein CFP56_57564 [Quercus suber]
MKSPWDDLETLFRLGNGEAVVSPSCNDIDSAFATGDDMAVNGELAAQYKSDGMPDERVQGSDTSRGGRFDLVVCDSNVKRLGGARRRGPIMLFSRDVVLAVWKWDYKYKRRGPRRKSS